MGIDFPVLKTFSVLWKSYCPIFIFLKLIFKGFHCTFPFFSPTKCLKTAVNAKYLYVSDGNECILSNNTDHLRDLSIFIKTRTFICICHIIFRTSPSTSIGNGLCSTLQNRQLYFKIFWFQISEEFMGSSLRHPSPQPPHKYPDFMPVLTLIENVLLQPYAY